MANSQTTNALPKNSNKRFLASALKIRRATWEDMQEVAKIIRSSAEWYEEFVDEKDLDEHYVGDKWIAKNFWRREFYVGENAGKIVGTISMQNLAGYAYLGYIYLHVDHVGNGYGKTLMDFAQAESKKRNRKGLVLIAHPKAKWATKAYLKFGFKKLAETKQQVLDWQDGALEPYYEEGFELYQKSF